MPPDGGMVLGTAPKDGKQATLNALFVNVNSAAGRHHRPQRRGRERAAGPVVAAPGCSRIEITSSDAGTFATFVGLTDPTTGKELRTGFADPNLRPQIVGVFTDLIGPAPPGLSLSATIDTRFSTKPTSLKLAAMLGAIVATIVALVALWRLDRLDGRRMHSLIPARWRTFTAADVVVVGSFLLWHVIGANSSDDGYILGMARVADHAGYMSNYFRWFGSPEDPFGWYYNLLALMTHVSDASIWMRLPDLICCAGVLAAAVPRGAAPARACGGSRRKAAVWAAGLVLLAAWMPFNNGLRPEGQIAIGALITYVLIERAIISGRMTPAALAVVAAAFTLGIQPTGLIAVAALLAGGRPLLRILVRRHRLVGTWPLVAPLLAAGTVVLTVVFADQTLATVLEATRIRTAIGPSQAWYTENLRYYYLILPTVDGSLSRRFGFLITALSLFVVDVHHVAAQAGSRCGPRPGVAADGHHLRHHVLPDVHPDQVGAPLRSVRRRRCGDGGGGHGAGVAGGAALVAQPDGVVTAVLFLLALCFATTNGWWYVSSFGVPFNNAMPKIGGITVSTIFFALFAIAAIYTVWLHFASRDHGEGRFARALTAAPIPVAAGFMVVVFVASMLVGVVRQYPTYSNAWANLRTFTGGCGLADDVLVEPDTNAGFMTPLPGNYGPLGPLGGDKPVGFTPNGVPDHIVAEAIRNDAAAAGHRLRLGRADEADDHGRQRVDGAAALRPRPGAGSGGRHLCRRSAAAEHADLGVVRAARHPTTPIRSW